MNDNETVFLLPLFSLEKIQKAEGKMCLKDLTAKTINIYYRDIKKRIFFFFFFLSFLLLLKCVALINSLVECSHFIHHPKHEFTSLESETNRQTS
jgi:hypothetical protein